MNAPKFFVPQKVIPPPPGVRRGRIGPDRRKWQVLLWFVGAKMPKMAILGKVLLCFVVGIACFWSNFEALTPMLFSTFLAIFGIGPSKWIQVVKSVRKNPGNYPGINGGSLKNAPQVLAKCARQFCLSGTFWPIHINARQMSTFFQKCENRGCIFLTLVRKKCSRANLNFSWQMPRNFTLFGENF